MPGSFGPAAPFGGRLSFWGKLALGVGLWPLVLVLADPVWRLGLPAAWDEVAAYDYLASALKGLSLPFGLFRGGLHLSLLLPFAGHGYAGLLHLPVALGLMLEVYLLWRLARQRAGEEAAFFAVFFHAVSRLTLLRLKLTVALSLAPLWALLGWSAVTWPAAAPAGLVAAFLAGAMALDYEATALVLPGLAFILIRRWFLGERRQASHLGLALLLGMLLRGLPATNFSWHDYWSVRSRGLHSEGSFWLGLGENLAGFFGLGSKPMLDYGPGAISVLALLFLPLGIVALGLDGALLISLGLATLAAPMAGHFEAHRAAVAWAPLCLGAGAGIAAVGRALAQRWGGRAAWGALLGLCLVWAVYDRMDFLQGQHSRERNGYDYAWRLWRANGLANQALQDGKIGELIADVNFRSMEARRLFGETPPAHPSAPPWVLLSGEQVGAQPPDWGQWIRVRNDPQLSSLWLLQPKSPELWRSRQVRIRGLLLGWEGRPWGQQLAQIETALRAGEADPFIRSILLDRALWAAKDVGMPSSLALLAADFSDLSVRQCLGLAQMLETSAPMLSLKLLQKAMTLDPARASTQVYQRELNARLKRP